MSTYKPRNDFVPVGINSLDICIDNYMDDLKRGGSTDVSNVYAYAYLQGVRGTLSSIDIVRYGDTIYSIAEVLKNYDNNSNHEE